METNTISVKNPATGILISEIKSYSVSEGIAALKKSRIAQSKWASLPLKERIVFLKKFQHVLVEAAEELCELIAKENGKPLGEAMITEVLPVIDLTAYFCKKAPKILKNKKISMHLVKYRKSYIHYKPKGIVYVISPWNFPFCIPAGEIIMALLAGNSVIHKPASVTPLIALKTRELLLKTGIDPDVYQVLPMSGAEAFQLIGAGVDYVNFTGSTAVGEKVAAECGRLFIPCSMELGGKDPAIVCEDANIDHAASSLVWGAFANAGQVCASVERAYVHESIYEQVVEKIVKKVNSLKVGDPLDGTVSMGPMTDPGQFKIVIKQMEQAKLDGAKFLTGGSKLEGAGQFFAPTVLVNVNDQMECVKEETFGPTLPIMKYSNIEDAIARANDSQYGLNAYVFSRDVCKAKKIAEQLKAGTVMINEVLMTHGLPETPWSGVKRSGVGRVHSDDGLKDLCTAYHVNYNTWAQPSVSLFWQPYTKGKYKLLLGVLTMIWGKGFGSIAKGLKKIL